MRGAASLAILLVCGQWAHAQAPAAKAAPQAGVEQFVGEKTYAAVTVDVSKLQWRDIFADQHSIPAAKREQLAKWSQQIQQFLNQARSILEGEPAYLTLDLPASPEDRPIRVFVKSSENSKLVEAVKTWPPLAGKPVVFRGDYLVLGDDNGFKPYFGPQFMLSGGPSGSSASEPPKIEKRDAIVPAARPDFSAAQNEVAEFPIRVAVVPPEYVIRTMRELLPTLPPALGGGPSTLLTDGLQWAALGVDPAGPRAKLVVQSRSEQAAQALGGRLPDLVNRIVGFIPQSDSRFPPELRAAALALINPVVKGTQVHLDLTGGKELTQVVTVLGALADIAADDATHDAQIRRFKQLGLGMHNYLDVYRSFPPAEKMRNAEGKSGLSWRVHLLPYLDQNPLYQQFHLDEPWDSEHNIKLLEKIPEIFQVAGGPFADLNDVPVGSTLIQAPVGEKTITGGTKPVSLRDITDGTSNTIFFVEVKPELAVPWTKPQDYQFDPANPSAGLLPRRNGGFIASFADGSVRLLPAAMSAKNFLYLFEMNDGNVIEPF